MKRFLFRSWLAVLVVLVMNDAWAQQKPAYLLYTGTGEPAKYRKMLQQVSDAEVLLFGELHNNPIAHWLQLELLQDLHAVRDSGSLILGAEMFETHQQAALDSLLAGQLTEQAFAAQTTLWPNYDTDYRPWVRFAKAHGLPFIATNCPREVARQVSRQGPGSLDSLPDSDRALLAPLPYPIDYELPSYARMRDMMGGHDAGGMNMDYFIAAQAIKDATMAHAIAQARQPGQCFFHLNGSYHSDDKEGIAWYLHHYQPSLRIANLTVVEQADLNSLEEEHMGKADFIIVVPQTMTKTYLSGFE
jgi:uncharacterized iron-regulated protein